MFDDIAGLGDPAVDRLLLRHSRAVLQRHRPLHIARELARLVEDVELVAVKGVARVLNDTELS